MHMGFVTRTKDYKTTRTFDCYNSILLHSGQNPAWHFCLSTRFSFCLKMKSVENIRGQIYRFTRGCKPREYLWNCSRKYPKMFKTGFIFRQQKNQVWTRMSRVMMLLCIATGCFVAFLGDFILKKRPKYKKEIIYCPALELFCCIPLWKTVQLSSSRAFSLSTPTF